MNKKGTCVLIVTGLPHTHTPFPVPDLSQLDPKVVQLLALQRVQQLLSKPPQTDRCHTSSNSTLEADVDTLKEQGQLLLNGWSLSPGSLPHIPHRHPMKGKLIKLALFWCQEHMYSDKECRLYIVINIARIFCFCESQ